LIKRRIDGKLAVSRAIGDLEFKKWAISKPECIKTNISNDDMFLILATDGLWDVVTNEIASKMVQKSDSVYKGDMNQAAWDLSLFALNEGSTDNISVIVVDLRAK